MRSTPSVDHEDRGREREVRLPALGRQTHVGEHPCAVVVAGQQEQLRLVLRHLLVVVTDPVDGEAVAEVLGAALDQPHVAEGADGVQRRKHGQREGVERVADLRDLRDEGQRHQRAGHRADVQRGPGGGLEHRLRPGALEGEVLGCQRGHQRLAIGLAGHLIASRNSMVLKHSATSEIRASRKRKVPMRSLA
jgi:hypothetical protein